MKPLAFARWPSTGTQDVEVDGCRRGIGAAPHPCQHEARTHGFDRLRLGVSVDSAAAQALCRHCVRRCRCPPEAREGDDRDPRGRSQSTTRSDLEKHLQLGRQSAVHRSRAALLVELPARPSFPGLRISTLVIEARPIACCSRGTCQSVQGDTRAAASLERRTRDPSQRPGSLRACTAVSIETEIAVKSLRSRSGATHPSGSRRRAALLAVGWWSARTRSSSKTRSTTSCGQDFLTSR